MATVYNPLEDRFVVFNAVETPKVELKMPLFDEPLDMRPMGVTEVTDNGNIVMGNNLKDKMINDNPTPSEVIYIPQENSKASVNNTPIIPKDEWTKKLAQAYRKLGVSENGIRNLIAKNALESNWGKSAQGKYNYGNITTGKSWKGKSINGKDHDAKGNLITNKFRSYDSIEEFAKDEVDFLKRLYDFNDNDDINTFTQKLQGGNKGKRRYAEDPKYQGKVKSIYSQLG